MAAKPSPTPPTIRRRESDFSSADMIGPQGRGSRSAGRKRNSFRERKVQQSVAATQRRMIRAAKGGDSSESRAPNASLPFIDGDWSDGKIKVRRRTGGTFKSHAENVDAGRQRHGTRLFELAQSPMRLLVLSFRRPDDCVYLQDHGPQ